MLGTAYASDELLIKKGKGRELCAQSRASVDLAFDGPRLTTHDDVHRRQTGRQAEGLADVGLSTP